MRGFAPARRGSFARPFALLRASSGQALLFREMEPFVGASFFLSLSVMPDIFNRASSIFAFSFVKARDDTQVVPYRIMVPARRGEPVCPPCFSCSIGKEKDTGFPLKACGNDSRERCPTLHVAIDCQRKSHDNGGLVARGRNCTITLLTKEACCDDEEIFQAYRRTTQQT